MPNIATKLLIVGRSGSGKSHFAKMLEETMNMKVLKSYTTRKQRDEKDTDHIFIERDDFKNYTNIIAQTEINNEIYFATKDLLEQSDIYIIDPNGILSLMEEVKKYDELKNTIFNIIYIHTNDLEKQEEMLKNRSEQDREKYKKRMENENEQFTEFEQFINGDMTKFDSLKDCTYIYSIRTIVNNYNENTFITNAMQMAIEYNKREQIARLINECHKKGLIELIAKEEKLFISILNEGQELMLPLDVFIEENAMNDKTYGHSLENLYAALHSFRNDLDFVKSIQIKTLEKKLIAENLKEEKE